jgi:hypothetical protein
MVIGFALSKSVLNAKTTVRVFPFDGAIDTGDLAGAAFQTPSILDHHLPFFVQRIEICRTGINAETLFAGMADVLVQRDMGFFIVFKGIERKLLGDLHLTHLSLSCHSRADGNPGINIIRKRSGFLLPQE